MNILRASSRVLLGLVFIFSGFTKIIDPVGVGLIISEYFKILGFTSIPQLCQFAGIVLSAVELLLGICLLSGIKMKVSSTVAMIFISMFLVITLLLAIFNPIHDCGCFGEAVKLTNWQTFFKNIVLFICAFIVFKQRDKFIPIAPNHWEWILAAIYGLSVMIISIYCLRHLPFVDFTEYKQGADLREKIFLQTSAADQPVFETVLIYKKGKTIKEFTVENIPDSTWTFIDSRSKQINAKIEPESGAFAISDRNGDYLTDSLISLKGALFVTSIPLLDDLSAKKTDQIKKRDKYLKSSGVRHIILCGSSFGSIDSVFSNTNGYQTYYTDYKTLITLNRSNGGMIYIFDGQIAAKWSFRDADRQNIEEILKEDPELISANRVIKEHVTIEVAVAVLLLLIVIMRMTLRLTYKHNENSDGNIKEL
ncbi:MAG: DoxX family protein [Bacteroidales bacterium]|nr:DoxX family protein [Bacteroidales bacterium]